MVADAPVVPRARRIRRIVVVVVVVLVAAGALAAGLAYAGLPGVAGAPARVRALEHRHGGRDVGAWPRRLAAATVAVEDERFWHHGGIDPIAIGRALVATVTSGGDAGGSTIAQQLAKILYPQPTGGGLGVLRAIGLGVKLEQRFSKRRVLRMYLDVIYYGHGYWGARQASLGYFGVPAARLTWGEASLLAGLPQAPSLLEPTRHWTLARRRQRIVLRQLVGNHLLSAAAARAAYRGTPAVTPAPA